MRIKKWIFRMIAVCLVLALLSGLQLLLMPKYMSEIPEGALIAEYYQEKSGHDVIFIGDCEVYENFSPITLWREYGMTSYISGSAQQLIWQSYYLMEEILRYEKPKVFVFNVLSMKYNEPQSEPYNRLNLDGMRLGWPKLRAVQASMLDNESMLSYIFPLLRYHARWSELKAEDFRYLLHRDKKSHNGFLMRADVRPVTTVPTGRKLADYQFGANSYHYLDKMVELCAKNDIKLVLIKAPSLYPYWYEEWDQQMVDYAARHNLQYINFLDTIDEAGLDFNVDTYDAGLHLNLTGAEKMAHYFGQILQTRYQLPDHRNDPALQAIWAEKTAFYDNMRAQQLTELATFGYLKSFGGRKDAAQNTNQGGLDNP